MKHKFFVIGKRGLIVILAVMMSAFFLIFALATNKASVPKPEYTIVIDAGHGGRDGGAVGKTTGITESQLNLTYARTLKSLCEEYGIGVVMTRNDMSGLYDENASNKKRSEMEKRQKIINSSGADLMISIHMNSFPLASCKGAYVFYANGRDDGQNLAKSIQTSLSKSIGGTRDYVTVGDYYVLNTSSLPSALIECGFLSNPEEEKKLASKQYCQDFCYSILVGILSYFGM